MATKKAGGSSTKWSEIVQEGVLALKKYGGQLVKPGNIL